MINIWYNESAYSYIQPGKTCGPLKVRENLKKSLQKSNIEYSINQNIYDKNLLLDYSEREYKIHETLEHESCFIGPQFWPFCPYGRFLVENPQYYNQLITPSLWVKNKLIQKFNAKENKISIWPVGVDGFDIDKNVLYDCLIYFKRRKDEELEKSIKFLEKNNISYKVISYGNYNESEFETMISQAKFCFLLNGTESQGIAVQEIMRSNTPLFVWDVKDWVDQGEEYKVPSTSIPYWSDECGKVFYECGDMEIAFLEFYDKIDSYTPRKYAEREISLEASVKKLIGIVSENLYSNNSDE